MDWLLISNILLWITVLVLVVVILALARQIGVLYERVAPAGALMMNQQLKVGDPAPQLDLQTLGGDSIRIGGDRGKAQLVFFVSPDCPVCGSLIPVFKSAARAESAWLEAVLASDGETQDHRGYVESKGVQHFPYVVSQSLGISYGVSKLPYAVLIDEQGRVASMGIVNSREHLESLFEAKERRVGSIQDYMQQQANPNVEEANQA